MALTAQDQQEHIGRWHFAWLPVQTSDTLRRVHFQWVWRRLHGWTDGDRHKPAYSYYEQPTTARSA